MTNDGHYVSRAERAFTPFRPFSSHLPLFMPFPPYFTLSLSPTLFPSRAPTSSSLAPYLVVIIHNFIVFINHLKLIKVLFPRLFSRKIITNIFTKLKMFVIIFLEKWLFCLTCLSYCDARYCKHYRKDVAHGKPPLYGMSVDNVFILGTESPTKHHRHSLEIPL